MEKLSNNLLLLITNLSQQKDKHLIIRLFVQGLNSFLPQIFFSWEDDPDSDALLEVSTQKKIYGAIKFSNESLENNPVVLAKLQNAAQMLAVILERLEQEKLLSDEKKHLEQTVQERTSELETKVGEYEALYEEFKALNDQLKNSLEEIEKNEDRMRSILENSTNVFYRHDTEHRLTYLSPQVKKVLGYEPEEAMIKWTDLTTDNPINNIGVELTMKAINTGQPQNPYVLELFHKSGKKVFVEVREAPVLKNGKTIAIVGALVDITERRKAQHNLLQNRYYLKKAQEIGKIGTWDFDIQNDKLIWTEENYKIYEVPAETELNFQVFFDCIHPEDKEFVKEKWDNALKKESYDFEHRILVNNKVKWVKQKAFFEFSEGDIPLKAIGFTQEITDRKLAEEKLHESEERYKLLYRNAGIGVGFYSPDGKVIEFNEIAQKQLGKDKTELTGKTLHQLFPKKNADVFLKRIKTAVREKRNLEFEDHVELPSGNTWFLSVYSCVKDIIGKVSGVQIMSMDITQLKQTESELRQSEEKFKSYVENAPDGIFLTNKKGDILDLNAATSNMTGYSREQLLQMNLGQLLPKEDATKIRKLYNELLNKGYIRAEAAYLTKDADKRYWSVDVVKLSGNQFLGFTKDVTDRRERERKIEFQNEELENSLKKIQKTTRELRIAKEKAEESDRLKTAFLTNMSHEIRTPMNGILGFIDLLLNARVSGEQRERYLQMVQKSGERLLTTINDIIEISKIEAGEMPNNITRENVNELLMYLHAFFTPEAGDKGLSFKLSIAVDENYEFNTDRNKLESILTNLIKNAIKFTTEGEVEFGCSLKNGNLEFFVSDTGIGIQTERLAAVFDRFVQADLEISRPYEGSGLGLSIAKAYIEMLGGKIWAESEPGKGSRFCFTVNPEKFQIVN